VPIKLNKLEKTVGLNILRHDISKDHSRNMMQDLEKQLIDLLQPHKLSDCLNRDVSMFHYCIIRKLNLILKQKVVSTVAMLNE